MHRRCFKTLFIDRIFHLYGDWVLHHHLNKGGAGGMGLEGHNSGESASADNLGGFSRKERVVASKAGRARRDGDRSHTGVRQIKHWVKLDDESAQLLGEIVAIERAWGRQVHDEEVLAAMIRVGHRIRMIEAHIPAQPPRPRR
jgi:hypothetical protein